MLCQSSAGVFSNVTGYLWILLFPGIVATVLWSPFLLSGRIQRLFKQLPPTNSLIPTYGLVGITASWPFVVGFLWALTTAETGKMISTVTIGLAIVYIVGGPLVFVLGIPRFRVSWEPKPPKWRTWLVLVAGAVWYTLLFALPMIGLSLIFSLP